jgi:hypothetical protein
MALAQNLPSACGFMVITNEPLELEMWNFCVATALNVCTNSECNIFMC